jgi:Fic family protein
MYRDTLISKINFPYKSLPRLKELLSSIDKNFIVSEPIPWGTPLESRQPIFNIHNGKLMRTTDEVQSYYHALDSLLRTPLELSEEKILSIHRQLYPDGGRYKILPNDMKGQLFDPDTGPFVIKTTPPELVRSKMQQLIQFTNKELGRDKIHPLITIALFSYEFLLIHPFADGNGRTARILIVLLLLMAGYDFIKYVPFEKQLHENKWLYYRVLYNAQTKRGTGKEVITQWVFFLLYSLRLITTHKHENVWVDL